MAAVKRFAADGGLVFAFATDFRSSRSAACCPACWCATAGCASFAGRCGSRPPPGIPLSPATYLRRRAAHAIAHGEGCYTADERTLDQLAAEDRIAFRYIENPNGSMRDIAGILSAERNVWA